MSEEALLAVEAASGSPFEPNGFTPHATAKAAHAAPEKRGDDRCLSFERRVGMYCGRPCHGFAETDKNAVPLRVPALARQWSFGREPMRLVSTRSSATSSLPSEYPTSGRVDGSGFCFRLGFES